MVKRTATILFFTVSFFQIALCQDATGRGLQCYKCAFDQPCSELSSLVTCKGGERCSIIKGHSDFKVHEPIMGKDCISAAKCNSNGNIIHLSYPFRIAYSCCNTNYCNNGVSGAPPASFIHHFLLLVTTFLAILYATLS